MPAYYEFKCTSCGHQMRRYRNVRKCTNCGKHTLQRHDPSAMAIIERHGVGRDGAKYSLRIAIAGLEVNGQPADSENMAELIASNIEQAMKGKRK